MSHSGCTRVKVHNYFQYQPLIVRSQLYGLHPYHLKGFRGRWWWTAWMLKEFSRWTIQSVKDPYRNCTHSRARIILSGIIGYLWGLSQRLGKWL